MKDQNSVVDDESQYEKWERAKSLFLESLYKPDNELRSCAHNQKCYNEMMELREHVVDIVRNIKNPKTQ
tara:strand:+ start:723 stop:929 length:207 start_codon:yes stop_codon:yes gene_type:complete